jgi:FkbM family methyltransferase
MLLDEQDSLNLKNEPYEPVEIALIKFLLKPTDIALDVGAHVGYFTVLMAPLCKRVYAYEPEPYNYALLKKNVEKKNTDNVLIYDYAVTNYFTRDGDDTIPLYRCNTNSGMHRVYASKHCNDLAIQVDSVRLDDLPIMEPNFIKMDIEGSELGALKGMQNRLTNSKPTIIMEFHPPSIEEYGASPKEEYDFLKTLGYSIRLIPKISIPISFQELEKETRKESGRNVLCIPEGQKLF